MIRFSGSSTLSPGQWHCPMYLCWLTSLSGIGTHLNYPVCIMVPSVRSLWLGMFSFPCCFHYGLSDGHLRLGCLVHGVPGHRVPVLPRPALLFPLVIFCLWST